MALEERLKKLEQELSHVKKRNRRQLVLFLIAQVLIFAGVFAAGTATGQGDIQDVIRARGFILYDIRGNARGFLAMNEDTPTLLLTDENGRPRVGLFTNEEGSSISLSNEEGVVRLGLTATAGLTSINISDDANRAGMVLGTSAEGPSIRMMDQKGISRLVMGATEGFPASSIRLYDEKAEMIWRAP